MRFNDAKSDSLARVPHYVRPVHIHSFAAYLTRACPEKAGNTAPVFEESYECETSAALSSNGPHSLFPLAAHLAGYKDLP
jgi:hypothetical protein